MVIANGAEDGAYKIRVQTGIDPVSTLRQNEQREEKICGR